MIRILLYHLFQTSSKKGEDPPVQQYGSANPGQEAEQPTQAITTSSKTTPIPISHSAKPIGQFCFLERSYSINTPSCLVPQINELFKSICDRYDVAVVNREKVDEALTLFRQVIKVNKTTSMESSFVAWKDCLTNPRFTVTFRRGTDEVKDLKVRADNIPKERRKAQKHIRDLIDACQLFLQQKEFLQKEIIADLAKLESLSSQLQNLGKNANLSSTERKQLSKTFMMAQKQFSGFSGILDMFFTHVYSLMNEINTSVHVLEPHVDHS